MKATIYILLLLLFLISCKKDKKLILPDKIIAGQQSGSGISYFDFEPDIKCFISEPWIKQDTSIQLDLNKDGINDFTFQRKMSNPAFMGSIYDGVTLIPLDNNEICIIPTKYPDPESVTCKHSKLDWVNVLSASDTIQSFNLWTNKKSLIYEYTDLINQCWLKEGFWSSVVKMNDKFIGFKIVKENKNYYGWIGMYADNSNINSFVITDYAIIQEYPE
jgi:hypothetical protein